ncbi:MAG: hypothetical protein KF780_03030 [Sphingomonas sp.]|nr:hypothetical protein [Sphingomonas sp.]
MSVLLALLIAQIPPAPSGRELQFGDVEIVDPIAPMVLRYMQCIRTSLNERGGMNTSDRPRFRRSVDSAIRACAETRTLDVVHADQALSLASDYQDAERRNLAIRHAFEGSEQQLRDMPEIMDRIRQQRTESR